MNFDLANACLGFVNGMQLAATMIDAGQIDYALVVDGEGAREIHENTIERLVPAGRDPRRRAQPVRDADARLGCRRDGARAAPTSTPRGTASSAACCGPPPSTTSCASAT